MSKGSQPVFEKTPRTYVYVYMTVRQIFYIFTFWKPKPIEKSLRDPSERELELLQERIKLFAKQETISVSYSPIEFRELEEKVLAINMELQLLAGLNGPIWQNEDYLYLNVERVYDCRYDGPSERLAAA
jgi:hypothetical protein